MFELSWSELMVIAIVAIVVMGPKELPKLMRGLSHYIGKVRRVAADFQRQFEEAAEETDPVRKSMERIRAGLHKPVPQQEMATLAPASTDSSSAAPVLPPPQEPRPVAKATAKSIAPPAPKRAAAKTSRKPPAKQPKAKAKPKARP